MPLVLLGLFPRWSTTLEMACFCVRHSSISQMRSSPGGSYIAPLRTDGSLVWFLAVFKLACVCHRATLPGIGPRLPIWAGLVGWNTVVMKEPGSNIMPERGGDKPAEQGLSRVVDFHQHHELWI